MKGESDAALVRRVRDGEADAYAGLVARYRDRLGRYALHSLGNRADAEDAVQETLLALHASRHLYDPSRPFMPFLLGIMRFRGADVMRRHRRTAARETPIDDLPETSAAFATNSTQEQALDAGALHAAVARLPAGQRQAIELTKLQEMSLEQASAASGTSVAALKVATHRGVRALRRLIEGSR